jgi:serine protease DegS/serine protease DegQ
VNPGSAAEEGGIRPGDVILAVDGGKLKEPRELIELLAPMRAGRNIAVTVQRDSR